MKFKIKLKILKNQQLKVNYKHYLKRFKNHINQEIQVVKEEDQQH